LNQLDKPPSSNRRKQLFAGQLTHEFDRNFDRGLLLFLTGCGSLPLPDKTMPIDGTVRVEGVREPLSVQQSRAILAKLDLGVQKPAFLPVIWCWKR
jgi:hypothetical protein